MTTEGIEAVFLETHNWGKAAKFFQALGFELEFASHLRVFEVDQPGPQLGNASG